MGAFVCPLLVNCTNVSREGRVFAILVHLTLILDFYIPSIFYWICRSLEFSASFEFFGSRKNSDLKIIVAYFFQSRTH